MTTTVPTTTPVATDANRWRALAVLMTATLLDLVDVTIVNIAVPSIRRDLGASASAIQWITGGYALAFAVGLITGGRLGDLYGRKRMFLIGIGGFTLASAVCGFAPDPGLLVVARIVQGAAAALMVPQVLSIIHVTFPGRERGKVFGMFGAMTGLGAISGPILGALLVQWNLFGLEWRPIFLINLPVGLAGLYFGRRYITESKAPRAAGLDLVGVALVTVALLLPLTQGGEAGWPLWAFASILASVPMFVLFLRYERRVSGRGGSPLVELSLFSVKSFSAGIGVQLTYGIVSGMFFLVWTLYMQLGLGWSPIKAGLTGVPFTLAAAVAAGVSVQQLVPRFGRKVLQAGAVAKGLGALAYIWVVAQYGADATPWHMLVPLVLMGIGMGLIIAPITATVLSEVPRSHSGSASGLINTTNQLGVALGLGLVSVSFFAVLSAETAVGYGTAFANALWWVVGGLALVFLLVFRLPSAPASLETGD